MTVCLDMQEHLLLDVYGELDSPQRSALRQHLAGCPRCREEHRELLRLLSRIKEAVPAAMPSEEKARALSSLINRKLLQEETPWPYRKRLLSPGRLLPALAAFCLVIICVGWFTFRMHLTGPSHDDPYARNAIKEEQLSPNDLEIVRNLDLLEDLDVLKMLVRAVDDKEESL